MIRTLAAAAALAVLSLAGAASAQTWGQPIYVGPYGRVVGGTPLSEVETRSYVSTGRWADGYADQAWVYVPAPVYGERYGRDYGDDRGYGRYDRYGYGRRGYGDGHGHAYGRGSHEPRPRPGYRDVWGYNDDRPPSARRWSRERRADRGYDRDYDRGCGCADVYLYDR